MVTRLTDLRCPTPMCGKKLADIAIGSIGEIKLKCPRCRQIVTIRFS